MAYLNSAFVLNYIVTLLDGIYSSTYYTCICIQYMGSSRISKFNFKHANMSQIQSVFFTCSRFGSKNDIHERFMNEIVYLLSNVCIL